MKLSTVRIVLLLLVTAAPASDKPAPSYQSGVITAWSNEPYARRFGHVLRKKEYELKGTGVTYEINDCGTFTAGQTIDYRVDGKKIYIRQEKDKDKENKCTIDGVKTDTSSTAP